jgi:hypothetical protein
MRIRSELADLPAERVRTMLNGLPPAPGYRITVKSLRYRQKPHLSAWTDFDGREIVLQVPQPFFPFGEIVPYAAKRRPGKGMRFIWLTEGVTFRTPREVVRFLYLHEFMHVFLHRQHGRGMSAETTCDRLALRNYRKAEVTLADARQAMKRQPAG